MAEVPDPDPCVGDAAGCCDFDEASRVKVKDPITIGTGATIEVGLADGPAGFAG